MELKNKIRQDIRKLLAEASGKPPASLHRADEIGSLFADSPVPPTALVVQLNKYIRRVNANAQRLRESDLLPSLTVAALTDLVMQRIDIRFCPVCRADRVWPCDHGR